MIYLARDLGSRSYITLHFCAKVVERKKSNVILEFLLYVFGTLNFNPKVRLFYQMNDYWIKDLDLLNSLFRVTLRFRENGVTVAVTRDIQNVSYCPYS